MEFSELKTLIKNYNLFKLQYEQIQENEFGSKAHKNILKQYNEIKTLLCEITGKKNPEQYFYVTLYRLNKHLKPFFQAHNLVMEAALVPVNNSSNDSPYVDVRIKQSSKNFGVLYYHLQYFHNCNNHLNCKTTNILLKPLFNSDAWNNFAKSDAMQKLLWDTFEEQLIADGRMEQLQQTTLPKKETRQA